MNSTLPTLFQQSPTGSARLGLAGLAAALAFGAPGTARADAVTDWNAIATTPMVFTRLGSPPFQVRALAIVHIAVHDALNSIAPRYRTYHPLDPAPGGASPDAAIAAAAHTALVRLFDALPPASAAETAQRVAALDYIDARYAAVLGADLDPAEEAGIAIGERAANTAFLQRHVFNGTRWVASDGAQAAHEPAYIATGGIGAYALTGPSAAFTGWEFVTPFATNSAAQFATAPGRVLDVRSRFYADQYNEVKHQGDARVRGAHPDSQQTRTARFWPAGGWDWNGNLRLIVDGRGLDRWQHARLFALANMAMSDALVSLFRSKYQYRFWRPITAIRTLDDGNPRTTADPGWVPFSANPPYPDYPCGSPGLTGAATQTLRNVLGTNALGFTRSVRVPAVVLPAPMATLPETTITRTYNSLSIAENEQARGRMYEGIHFSEGCHASIKTANRVADWVYQHALRPY